MRTKQCYYLAPQKEKKYYLSVGQLLAVCHPGMHCHVSASNCKAGVGQLLRDRGRRQRTINQQPTWEAGVPHCSSGLCCNRAVHFG